METEATEASQAGTTASAPPLEHLEKVVCEFLTDPEETRPLDHNRLASNPATGHELQRFKWMVGERYWRCTIDDFQIYDPKQEAAVKQARDFAQNMPATMNNGGGLILLGRPGSGKDHLASALGKIAIAKHRFRVQWFDGSSLFDDILAAMRDDTWLNLKRRLVESHILIVSDPQPPRGSLTDSQVRHFRSIIDMRYRKMLPVWLTINLDTRADADELFSAATMERIVHGATQIYTDWESYRERNKN